MSKFEIIIKKDSQKIDVDLNAMSLSAAHAFSVILDSMLKIGKGELDVASENIRLAVSSGSAVLAIEGTDQDIEEIEKEFENVISKKSHNRNLVSGWRTLHELFETNGLEYEAAFTIRNQVKPVYDRIRNAKNLRVKHVSGVAKSSLVFFDAKLIAVGGKVPNIHIEGENNKRIIISCTEKNALKANAFLYKRILMSAWKVEEESGCKYQMCDSYFNEEIFLEFKNFFEAFTKESDEIESLKMLHYRCRKYIELQEELQFSHLRKFLKLFAHPTADINVLNTILIVTHPLAVHRRLYDVIIDIDTIFKKKLSQYKRNKSNTNEAGRDN